MSPVLRPPSPSPLPWRPYLALLVPLILGHMLQSLGGFIDAVWLGQLLGVPGIAAAAAFVPVFFVLLALAVGLGAGASILSAQAWGAGDTGRLQRVAATALAITAAAGVAVAIAGAFGTGALMRALGTPEDVLREATAYARTMLLGMPLAFTVWTCMALSRGAGDPVSPMWALVAACIFGAACTPLLVLAGLGAMGAALSSMAAQGVALAFLARRWRRAGHPLAPRRGGWPDCRPDARIARQMLRIGVPAAVQMLAMAVAEMVLLGLVNRHGSGVTAAYGAAGQILGWVQFPAMSLGIAASILSAQAIGAGRQGSLGSILHAGLRLNAVVTTLFVAAAYLLAPAVLRLFLQDDAILAIAVGLLRTVAWSVVLLGWSNVLVGTMRASGTVVMPTALGMVAMLGAEVPAALLLEARFGLPGLWWAYPAGFGAMLLLQSCYCAGVWRGAVLPRTIFAAKGTT